jgi:hypothetical protein
MYVSIAAVSKDIQLIRWLVASKPMYLPSLSHWQWHCVCHTTRLA